MTKYTLTIAYQRESTTLSDLDGDATTVGDIKAQLAQIYQVPEPAQSLLYRGKKLQDNTALLDSLGFPMTGQIKLMLLGTRADDAAKVVAALAAATAPPPARGPGYKPVPLYNRVSSKSSPHTLSSLATEHTNHTFLEIQTLPQFSNQAGARAILERLRDDPGIARVMQTRRWTVGQLIELSPAEATILGYNRNRGQVIALRLRTNDLSGFRAYRNIRMVLIHELAHMVFDEHANDFKALNSELTKDVGRFERESVGHLLDPSAADEPVFPELDDDGEDADHVDQHGYVGGTFVLGGGGTSSQGDGQSMQSARERAAQAAQRRSHSSK